MPLIVKAWSARGGFWIGEPRRLDGAPITSMVELANYVEWNGHLLLYIWPAGEGEQRQDPRLLNVSFIESWQECGFDEVIRNLPDRSPGARKQRRRRKQRRHTP